MLSKVILITATTSGLVGNTSIANMDLQVVIIKQL
jgi:ribulose 1,5-bisphosphate synthetase/thiazole synthase